MIRSWGIALVLMVLGTAAAGEEVQIAINTNGLDTMTYGGRTLYAAEILIPEAIVVKDLVSARVEVKFGPEEEADNARTELQVAAWANSGPVVPEGRLRPISLSIHGDNAEVTHIDVSRILEPIFATGQEASLLLVFGQLLNWEQESNRPVMSELEPQNDIWGILHLTLR